MNEQPSDRRGYRDEERERAEREAEELEDGSLDPDELGGEPEWDEGSDVET